VLPANFFTRASLQSLSARTQGLIRDTNDLELLLRLQELQQAAINLDGTLADIPPSTHPVDRVLANPDNWTATWVKQSWHFQPGLDVVVHRQQLSRGPILNVTNRLRVQLGTGELVQIRDPAEACDMIRSYLTPHRDELPRNMVESCLASLE